jgi:hypothetical protein
LRRGIAGRSGRATVADGTDASDSQKAFNIWEITVVITSKYLPSKRIVSANFKTAMQTMADAMGFIMPSLRTALEKC